MLKFEAIGDGNCLYNAEAIFLVRSFLENKLEPLFKNKARLKEFHRLLQQLQTNNVITIGEEPTAAVVKAGFAQLIKNFTIGSDVDWRALQRLVAPSLREYVQNAIINDEAIQQKVKIELTRAFDQCIDMAYLNNHNTENALPQSIDVASISGAHFEGMEEIVNKIKAVLQDDSLLSPQLKKIALGEWFFSGAAVGFGEYLQGENGIGNPAIHAGDIELNVLSANFGIVHKTFMRNAIGNEQSATYYNAFKTPDMARKVAKNAIVFTFEKSSAHWNCLFDNTPENQAWLVADEQRVKLQEIDAYAAIFGDLDAHRNSLGISIEDYCTLYGLTKEQFRDGIPQKKQSAKATQEAPLVDEPKKPELATTAPLPASVSAPVSASPRIETPVSVGNTQNYWKYFATATLALIFFSHCLVMPILQAAFAGFSHLSLLGVAALSSLSVFGGYAYAEKMQSVSLSSNLIANQGGASIVTSAKPAVNSLIDLQNNPPTLVAYYNAQAQEQKREQHSALEGRPKGPRQKLH